MNGLTAQALIHTYTSPRSRGEVFLTRQDVADASKVADQIEVIQLDGSEFEKDHQWFWKIFDQTIGKLTACRVEAKTIALIRTNGGLNSGNPIKTLNRYRQNFGNIRLKEIFELETLLVNHGSQLMQYFCRHVMNAQALDVAYNALGSFRLKGKKVFPQNIKSGDLLSQFLCRDPNFQAVRNRYRQVVKLVKQFGGGEVLSIACGSANPIVEAVSELKQSSLLLTDSSSDALKLALSIAHQAQISERVEILQVPWIKLPRILANRKFDVVEICGLGDYLSDRSEIKLIEIALGFLKPEGKIIVSNMVETQPASDLLRRRYNWDIPAYRTPKKFKELIQKGGGKNIKIYLEPWGIHSIATATI